jgi:hypothetical protein
MYRLGCRTYWYAVSKQTSFFTNALLEPPYEQRLISVNIGESNIKQQAVLDSLDKSSSLRSSL